MGHGHRFPNPSRSYDAKHRCVRFWGHDDSREVSFLVDDVALLRFGGGTIDDEAGLLRAFDGNRERVLGAARKVYSRRGAGFYKLALSDF